MICYVPSLISFSCYHLMMVSRYDYEEKEVRHFSVNACMAPLCTVDGLVVTTVEGIGIGSTQTVLYPVR